MVVDRSQSLFFFVPQDIPTVKQLYVMYGVVFLTGPPDFQYQNEKNCSANEELFYIENFVKN